MQTNKLLLIIPLTLSISSILYGSKFKFLVVKFGPNPVMLRLHVHSCLNLLKINKTCLRNLNKNKKHILELRKMNTIPHLVRGLLDCYLCNGESTTICLPGKLSQFILSRVEYCSVAYMVMTVMFNTTFNIISVISLWSVLLVDET